MTEIPLYKNHTNINEMPDNANAGLWYDKFCNQWQSWKEGVGNNKKDWIKTVTEKPIGNAEEIEAFIKRRKNLIQNSSGVNFLFRTDGRFVTGMGKNHPVENGFIWHHTLGIPYIPGTSVKGIVRAYARWLKEDGEVSLEKIDRIFGPDDKKKNSRIGSVIFLDAIPSTTVQLSADIMTPHYEPYYTKEKIPGDWYPPIPIPFLTVDNQQKFIFSLIPRTQECEDDLKMSFRWLREALESFGVGAKTAVGYGRFIMVETKSKEETWIQTIADEQGRDREEVLRKCPKIIRERWTNITSDDGLKHELAILIKMNLKNMGLWEKRSWGELKRLKRYIKKYLGE